MSFFEDARLRKFKRALNNPRRYPPPSDLWLSDHDRNEVGLTEADCKWCVSRHADKLLDHIHDLIITRSKTEWTRIASCAHLMWAYLDHGSEAAQVAYLRKHWPVISKWLTTADSFHGVSGVFGKIPNACESRGVSANRLRPTGDLLAALKRVIDRWDSFDLPEDPMDDERPRRQFTAAERDAEKAKVLKAYELLAKHAVH